MLVCCGTWCWRADESYTQVVARCPSRWLDPPGAPGQKRVLLPGQEPDFALEAILSDVSTRRKECQCKKTPTYVYVEDLQDSGAAATGWSVLSEGTVWVKPCAADNLFAPSGNGARHQSFSTQRISVEVRPACLRGLDDCKELQRFCSSSFPVGLVRLTQRRPPMIHTLDDETVEDAAIEACFFAEFPLSQTCSTCFHGRETGWASSE